MAFAPGDPVQVAALGRGVVREVRNGGRYLVDVKGRSMLVEASQLTAVEPKKRRARATEDASSGGVPERLARAHARASIDLHGMTVDEAVEAFDAFLDEAILAGLEHVQVIHGRSGGRLKAAIHSRLTLLTSIRAFRVDPANPGVTRVSL